MDLAKWNEVQEFKPGLASLADCSSLVNGSSSCRCGYPGHWQEMKQQKVISQTSYPSFLQYTFKAEAIRADGRRLKGDRVGSQGRQGMIQP